MKTPLLYFVLLISANTLSGQYIHFPDSNAVWSEMSRKYFIKGDSIVNSKTYKKYYFTTDSNFANTFYCALLREDTILKKVYSIGGAYQNESLLYDFSLNVNDTVTVYPYTFPGGPAKLKVDSIDSLFLFNRFHKRLKVSGINQFPFYEEYWIAGIGSTCGLFNSGASGILIFDILYPELICFHKDGERIYRKSYYKYCYYDGVGFSEYSKSYRVSIHPNPAMNHIVVEAEYVINGFKIYSMDGQLLINESTESEELNIDISDLPEGVYILYLESNGLTIPKKIIKSH